MEPTRVREPDATDGESLSPEEERESVELINLFLKALKAYRLYEPNNRTLRTFVETFAAALKRFLDAHGEFCVRVNQFSIVREGTTIYENPTKEESLAFRLFIHGIREISFHPGVPGTELEAFLEVLHRSFDAKTSLDDLLSLLWEKDLQYVTFIILDDFFEEGEQSEFEEFVEEGRRSDDTAGSMKFAIRPLLDRLLGRARAGGDRPLPEVLDLTEDEVTKLSVWVEDEQSRDLIHGLCATLLELLDPEADAADSEEVLAFLDRILEALLEDHRYREAIRLIQGIRGYRLTAGEDTPAARMAKEALGKIGGDRMVRYLEPHLRKAQGDELEQLVDFLESLDQTAVPVLVDLLEDPDTKRAATRALKRLAREHFSLVVLRLKDPRRGVVVAVLRLLGEIGDTRALGPIRGLVSHEETVIRREAIRAVGAIGGEGAFPLLQEVLADPEQDIRVLAVRGLGGLPAETIRGPLFEMARARDFRRRTYFEKKEVFLALAGVADLEIEEWLVATATRRGWFRREERDELRACAVAALARLATPAALEAIRRCGEDSSDQVRRAASQALRAV